MSATRFFSSIAIIFLCVIAFKPYDGSCATTSGCGLVPLAPVVVCNTGGNAFATRFFATAIGTPTNTVSPAGFFCAKNVPNGILISVLGTATACPLPPATCTFTFDVGGGDKCILRVQVQDGLPVELMAFDVE
jgi:hypothetical protein